MNSKRAVLFNILVLTFALPVSAEPDRKSPYQWQPKTTSVMIFKNGLGFFLREGQVALSDGWCVSRTIPPAAFGTLAVYSHANDQTVDIVAAGPGEIVDFDDADAPTDLDSKRRRIESCKNLKIQLTYSQQGAERTAAGELVSVGSDYIVLEAENNSFAVPLDSIKKLQVLENPLRVHVAGNNQTSPAEATLGMAYLRKGITWIPEYTLKLTEKDTAELTLRGMLVNEAEDLIHCEANFVVGVPHFVHSEYMSPIASGQAIRTIGAAIPSQFMNQISNANIVVSNYNGDMGNQFGGMVPTGRDLSEATGNLPQLNNGDASDFTVYARKDITLRVGEKAIMTLFTTNIRYEHLYRWNVSGPIEHYLVLHNDTDTPWTTGPCLVTGQDTTSEDMLRYVPKGGRGELPVTTAVNIANSQEESETKRALKAHEPSNNVYFDLVTLEGKLMLRNFGKTPAEMAIALPITGKPLTASDEGKINQGTQNLKLQDRTGSINWQITLAPGESKTLTYSYERYVPSN